MEDQPLTTQTYAALLASIKERIQSAQVRAALAVNRELVLLYWLGMRTQTRLKSRKSSPFCMPDIHAIVPLGSASLLVSRKIVSSG